MSKDIYEAAANGNLQEVKNFIAQGVDVNAVTEADGANALHFVVSQGNLDIFRLSDPESKIKPEEDSKKSERLEIARLLISAGINVNATTKDNATALHYAAGTVNIEIAALLIDNHANTEIISNSRNDILGKDSPMHFAAAQGSVEMMKLLVEKGKAKFDLPIEGFTLLICAIISNREKAIEYLLSKGANIKSQKDYNLTPLCVAAATGNLKLVQYLIDQKVDINILFKDEELIASPLHAAIIGNIDIAKLLMEHGAIPELGINEAVLNDLCMMDAILLSRLKNISPVPYNLLKKNLDKAGCQLKQGDIETLKFYENNPLYKIPGFALREALTQKSSEGEEFLGGNIICHLMIMKDDEILSLMNIIKYHKLPLYLKRKIGPCFDIYNKKKDDPKIQAIVNSFYKEQESKDNTKDDSTVNITTTKIEESENVLVGEASETLSDAAEEP